MFLASYPLACRQHPGLCGLRLRVFASGRVDVGEVAGGAEGVWMLLTQHPLLHRQHFLPHGLGLRMFPLGVKCGGKVGGGAQGRPGARLPSPA